MKIINKEKKENCFDGDFVTQVNFDEEWTEEMIFRLEELGNLKYYASFPRPMFQLATPCGSFIKGIKGTCDCRIIYSKNSTVETRERFEDRFAEIIKKEGDANGEKAS